MMTPNDIASQWFDSVGADLQDYQVPPAPEPEPDLDNPLADEPEPDPDRPFADTPEVTNDDLRNIQNLRAVSRPTAEVIVGTMDVLLPAAGAILLKGSDKDDLRLSDTEHDTLVEAWSAYLAGKSVQVSPGAALVLAILTIYGAKVATAVNNRRTRDRLEEQQREIEQLRTQLQTKEQEVDTLRRDIQTPPQHNTSNTPST